MHDMLTFVCSSHESEDGRQATRKMSVEWDTILKHWFGFLWAVLHQIRFITSEKVRLCIYLFQRQSNSSWNGRQSRPWCIYQCIYQICFQKRHPSEGLVRQKIESTRRSSWIKALLTARESQQHCTSSQMTECGLNISSTAGFPPWQSLGAYDQSCSQGIACTLDFLTIDERWYITNSVVRRWKCHQQSVIHQKQRWRQWWKCPGPKQSADDG